MNKAQLIDAIASESGLSKQDSTKALDALTKAVSETLSQGDSISLIGFGTFSVSARTERTGRNPKTGEKITIPAKKVAKFKAGKALDEKVNA